MGKLLKATTVGIACAHLFRHKVRTLVLPAIPAFPRKRTVVVESGKQAEGKLWICVNME